jgi:hypothetical protein
MAKDDYFVIAYKLLKYLYDCLKKGVKPSAEVLDADYFTIGTEYWEYILSGLFTDGYIVGVVLVPIRGRLEPGVKITPAIKITPKGIQHLEENSMFQKIKGAVKDIADVLPI